ncbi:hypothetical protein PoB_006824200 [Plakobranchus ocellatus]|uniref:Uncharacterized protein n=1 Tax=Plakobranchus ocellatus TaxID=259542 RepID=A0AAV4DCH7_9GAST|nr:hypothetical protein PoB_006824200 [Plakobranchus ocellatus]
MSKMLPDEGGVGGTVDSNSAPISAGTLLLQPVHSEVILDFQALQEAGTPVAGLNLATEGFLQISGQVCYPLVPYF